jgi:hypothetical protein
MTRYGLFIGRAGNCLGCSRRADVTADKGAVKAIPLERSSADDLEQNPITLAHIQRP